MSIKAALFSGMMALLLSSQADAQMTSYNVTETAQQKVDRLERQLLETNIKLIENGITFDDDPYATHRCKAACIVRSSKADSQGRRFRRIEADGYGGYTLEGAFASMVGGCERNALRWALREGLVGVRFHIIGENDYDDAAPVTVDRVQRVCYRTR